MKAHQLTILAAAAILLAGCQNKSAPPESNSASAPAPEAGRKGAEGKRERRGEKAEERREGETTAARMIEVPAGTAVEVRIDDALSTARNHAGDSFASTLVQPVVVEGREVLAAGTRFTGHITEAGDSGRLKGRAVLGLTLDSFEARGERHQISTTLDTKTSDAHKKRNLELIGGGGGLGALVGGLVGGGKGAAIGAAAGAGAGTAGAFATGKKEVSVPAETVFTFTLKEPVSLRE
jgi:outer membrane lipoprotein SlyB